MRGSANLAAIFPGALPDCAPVPVVGVPDLSLAAKTTCKDRRRQVINEADRLRDKPKFLCTLQQGISPAQMDEMQAENAKGQEL